MKYPINIEGKGPLSTRKNYGGRGIRITVSIYSPPEDDPIMIETCIVVLMKSWVSRE